MPYFWWQGTTITGKLFSGYVFSPSKEYLEKHLFKQHIALIKTKDYSFLMHRYTITLIDKAELYEQLRTLLENGIQLASACTLIAQQLANPKIQKILFACGQEIEAGNNINDILLKHIDIFDTVACQTIAVGVETGKLMVVCKLLSNYYETQAAFKKKMQAILLTPTLTGICVILVAVLLFIFFIPKLSALFATLHVEIPSSTQLLINISNFTRSVYMIYTTVLVIGLGVACILINKQSSCIQKIISSMCYHLPFVRLITIAHAQATFFSFLSILLNSNIPLPQALLIIANVLPSSPFKNSAIQLYEQVQAGRTLASAMSTDPVFFEPHHVAIVAIAQETACLPTAIENIAKKSFQKIDTIIAHIVFWTGPLLLLLLGMCVAGLMIAMYSPLVNLSYELR
ncbi:MAG TPA: type II secretion system F family protein [Patescibacteria group bacterium]|jgi:type II secretory pathway component PulF|nr:type II secretion system F family protein [Patescibacteria group bacterium]